MDNEFINKIKQFCNYFSDCNIDYHIKNDNNSKEIFFYDMHNLYSNEILITFPKNSSQTLKFLDKLYLNFSSFSFRMFLAYITIHCKITICLTFLNPAMLSNCEHIFQSTLYKTV